MTSLRHTTTVVAGATLALGAVFAGQATAADNDAPTYAEFKAATFQDTDRKYIVNGDEVVRNDRGLRQYYQELFHTEQQNDGLVINRVYGADDKWSATQVGNLTYCVSTRFGSDHGRVLQAMKDGANQWRTASSRINFRYVSAQDGNCNTRNNNVIFSVEPTTSTQYIARAFFPSSPKSARNILVNARALFSSGSWTPASIMAHEQGHTLGFRHEHTRPEAGTCFEDNNWRPLTPYDSASIMHYPQCNGSSSDLSMTETDRQGARSVYGS